MDKNNDDFKKWKIELLKEMHDILNNERKESQKKIRQLERRIKKLEQHNELARKEYEDAKITAWR